MTTRKTTTRKTTAKADKVKAVPGGEHAALEAAKVKAALAEAEAARKAVADAEAVKAAESALAALVPDLLTAEAALVNADDTIRLAQLEVGNVLLRAEAVIGSVNVKAWNVTVARWAEDNIPDECKPEWKSSRAYRSLRAARVAAAIGADTVGSASVDALVPLHRLLSRTDIGDTAKAVTKVFKSAKGRGTKPPTAKAVTDAMTKAYPTKSDAPVGPKSGTANAGNGARAKASKPRNTPTADKPVDLPDKVISASRLKAADNRVAGILGNTDATPIVVALGIVKACEDYGIGAVKASVEARKPAKAATK